MSLPIFFTYGGVVLSLSIELLLPAGYDGGKSFVQGPVLGRAVTQEREGVVALIVCQIVVVEDAVTFV